MPIPQQVRPFSSLLADVRTLHVVSRNERNRAPAPEEIAERARQEGYNVGQLEGYVTGMKQGRAEGVQQGHNQAYEQAYKEASAKCATELAELFEILAGHVAQVNAEIPEWFEQAESAMTDRTMTILRRMLAAELELGRDHALEIVKECLAEVTHSSHVRIRMNPYDSVVASQYREQLLALAPQLTDIDFVDDPSIVAGCMVESEGGTIDATIDTRLAIIQGDLAA